MSATHKHSPNSSNISHFEWHRDTSTLAVVFKNGGTYHYAGVPESAFHELVKAPSAGSYLHGKIKSKYTAKKIG